MSDEPVKEVSAREIFESIWKQFAADRKKSRSFAAAKLQTALAENAAELVPVYSTAKEFMSMVFECEEYTKEDKQSQSGDPMENMSDWLSGKTELSRIPLIGRQKN